MSLPNRAEDGRTGLSGRIVLVAGATGFIGSRLIRQLITNGAEVHGITRQSGLSGLGTPVRWWNQDLKDSGAVQKIVSAVKPDTIYHLASHVTGSRNLSEVIPTLESNLVSTVNLLHAAAANGCRRFLHAGSLEEPDPATEEPVPCSPYAAAKWAAGGYGRMFHSLYGLPFVNLRLFMVYGPGGDNPGRLIPYTTTTLLKDKAPEIRSGGRPADWIYIDDVVDALIRAATAPGVEGVTIDIGSGQLVKIEDVVTKIVEIVDPGADVLPTFSEGSGRPAERVRVADISQSERLLDWRPVVPLAEGLRRTVRWYEQAAAPPSL